MKLVFTWDLHWMSLRVPFNLNYFMISIIYPKRSCQVSISLKAISIQNIPPNYFSPIHLYHSFCFQENCTWELFPFLDGKANVQITLGDLVCSITKTVWEQRWFFRSVVAAVQNRGVRPCRLLFSNDVTQMWQGEVKLGDPFNILH